MHCVQDCHDPRISDIKDTVKLKYDLRLDNISKSFKPKTLEFDLKLSRYMFSDLQKFATQLIAKCS